MFGLTLAIPDLERATDMPTFGGPGGYPFRTECPKGSYLIGFEGRAGQWFDRLNTLCAPWVHKANVFGPATVGPSIGDSRGGRTVFGNCNGSGLKNAAIRAWTIQTLSSANRFISKLDIFCVSVGPPGPPRAFSLGTPTRDSSAFVSNTEQNCPAGEIATGIHGRAGLFVDAIGLVYAPFPPKAPLPFETNVNSNAKASSPPPSSSLAPPPPSTPSQIRRSPSMVMPRGVEDE